MRKARVWIPKQGGGSGMTERTTVIPGRAARREPGTHKR